MEKLVAQGQTMELECEQISTSVDDAAAKEIAAKHRLEELEAAQELCSAERSKV